MEPDINSLIVKLAEIPGEEHKDFAKLIRSFNAQNFPNGLAQQGLLQQIYGDNQVAQDTRFKAFYAHQVNYWRFSKYMKFRDNIDTYEDQFGAYKMFNNWRAQYYFTFGQVDGQVEDYKIALQYADKAVEALPNSPNILSFKADILISIEELQEEVDKNNVLEAKNLIDKAIRLNNGQYARHLVTKSRIVLLLGKYTEAKRLINEAIELEETSAADYSLRIGEFNATKIRIIVQEQKITTNVRTKSILKEVENLKVQLIELIGILVAVIALIITSVHVIKTDDFSKLFPLFLTIGGINLLTFSSYSLLFYRDKVKPAQIIMLLIGVALLVFSVLIHLYL